MSVLEASTKPFHEVDEVGLVIFGSLPQLHSGFLYLCNGEARALHLAFHHKLIDEPASPPFRWAQIGLDEINLSVFSILLSRIAFQNPRIPYGFDASGVIFDADTGDLLPPPAGKGLTCATFIVAVLRTYGLDLVLEALWPNRTSDASWQAHILRLLELHATAEHVDATKNEIGAKRFRPDEIVGAATVDQMDWPVGFQDAKALAEQVIADLSH